jgi:hypothetical protein
VDNYGGGNVIVFGRDGDFLKEHKVPSGNPLGICLALDGTLAVSCVNSNQVFLFSLYTPFLIIVFYQVTR